MVDRWFRFGDHGRYLAASMAKHNYIAKMSESTRKWSVIVLVFAVIVYAACFFAAVASAILLLQNKPNPPIGPLIGCILIFGSLTFATCWMAIRLIRNVRAKNGLTVMPEMFIQVFGAMFLIGIVTTAIINKNIWLVGESVGIAIGMITIRSLIRQE